MLTSQTNLFDETWDDMIWYDIKREAKEADEDNSRIPSFLSIGSPSFVLVANGALVLTDVPKGNDKIILLKDVSRTDW
jgi:hypothetical protein